MLSRTTMFLIASLAVNAGLLGVVGGSLLNPDKPAREGQAPRPPASDVVQSAWAQLPSSDRGELRQELRDRWRALADDRKALQDAGKAVHDAALLEPFDEVRLKNAVIIFQGRQQMMQQSAEDILIRHLGKMPPDARATAAVGLLTPFSARVKNAEHSPRRETDPKPPLQSAPPAAPPAGRN